MTLVKSIYFSCDAVLAHDCLRTSTTFTGPTSTEVKNRLRQDGWRFRSGVHRCPRCADAERALSANERRADNREADYAQDEPTPADRGA